MEDRLVALEGTVDRLVQTVRLGALGLFVLSLSTLALAVDAGLRGARQPPFSRSGRSAA